jgi:predicted ATPase/DNA-binding SARP family transcriptional activator/DNA-binding CsgD family transcriptional regulator
MRDWNPESVRVKLLGGFSVRIGSRTIGQNEWRLKKAASLVKMLALAPDHRLHREQSMEALWPHLGKWAASNNLRRTLHAARKALDPAASSRYLASEEEWLVLCPEGALWVDVEAFEEAAVTARREREPAAYRAALDLYAGELLPTDRYEEWTLARRQDLRRVYLTLLLELAGIYEESGEYEPAIEALTSVTMEDPAREGAHVGLMRLYALSGRQAEAIGQYELLEEALAREIEAGPNASSRSLKEEISSGDFPPEGTRDRELAVSSTASSGRHNLPAPRTSFVGRQKEMVELKRALAMTRLLTLTGAGGSGKTRLALEVARELVQAYPDGVWLVELAPLSEGRLVPKALAEAVGMPEQPGRPITDTLVEFLRDQEQLLVIDNCEHLVEATARLVDTLLDECPRLRILATSRAPLVVTGELNWLVPSLSVPDRQTSTVEEVEGHESARLFAARASYRRRDFSLTSGNASAVATICRGLDGMPLALELAAARVDTLSAGQIARRLDDSLMLLTGGGKTAIPRHRTLRGVLDWSYELLYEDEKKLFGRLSVFAGGWTLEAAEAVSAEESVEEDVLDLLSGLVEKSLVATNESAEGDVRYRLLEPVRQYALEKLEQSGEAETARRAHAEYFLALAETAEPELLEAGQGGWLRQLRTELGNLRGAISWSLKPGREDRESAQLRLRLAAALWRFWEVQDFEEGKRWLQATLERDPGGFPVVRAKALAELGWILLFQRDYVRAIAALEEAIALYKELGDESGTAFALGNLGYAVLHGGYRERLPSFVQEAEVLMQGDLDGHARALLRTTVASAAFEEDDLESAVAQLEENVALCRELGDLRNTSISLFNLSMAELKRDDLDRGATLLEEGARIGRDLGDRLAGVYYVWGLGKVAALQGEPKRAARLWGAAEALREYMGMSLSQFDLAHSGYERDLANARSSLDESTWVAAWSEGQAMSPEQAIEYALSTEDTSPQAVSEPRAPSDPLTRREREVALLVAQGRTNRRIAQELSISEHTVENHVAHILKKLDLHSREQIPSRPTQH